MAKIIEARAILSASDQTAAAFKSVVDKVNALSKANKIATTSGIKELDLYGKKIDALNAKAGAIDGFRAQQQALIAARREFRGAQAEVERLGRAMRDAGSPTRELTRDYERAQRAVKQSAAAFAEKTAAIKEAKSGLAAYGVTLKTIGREQMKVQTELGMNRRGVYYGSGPLAPVPIPGSKHAPAPADAGGGPAVIAGGPKALGAAAVAYGLYRAHGAVAEKHHDFQSAYLYQQAVLGLSPTAQASLIDQAVKIGQDTKFTNADIIKAQTDIGSKLPKEIQTPDTIRAITEPTKNYALAMKVSMEEASVAIVGWMKARGYDLSSPQAAEKSARRAANQMVEFAKTTGAKHHDLVGDIKFGAAPGRAGGFSEEYANALSAQLIRLGYEGAMTGTFVRAASMKLSAPTQKGLSAIAAAGLNFEDYVKPGIDPTVGGLSKMLQVRFGRGLNKDQEAKLKGIFDDETLRGDRGAFIEAATGVLNDSFAKKDKKGRVNAMDAERIAKTLNEFATLSAQGVDSERLMTDLVKRGITPAIAKYLFGSEQGGRAIALDPKQLEADLKTFRNVPETRAAEVAGKMQEGAQGEYTKMVGSVETFTVALGEATEGVRAFTYKGIGAVFDLMTNAIKGKPIASVPLDSSGIAGVGVTPLATNPLLDPAVMEQARRRQDFVRRDPEAARGEAFSKMTAKVVDPVPVDVTGKVALDPASKVDVNVSVKVQGQATVTGQSVTAGGNARGSVGTSMSEYGGGSP